LGYYNRSHSSLRNQFRLRIIRRRAFSKCLQ
jgi:hypothetical protein